jgi:hypothetical protein
MSKLAKALTAAAGNAGGGDNLYVEDVFSTYLYTGTGATQTITNGIDLDGEGGLVWIKARNYNSPHSLADTERGRGSWLNSSSSAAAGSPTATEWVTSFNSDGFSLGDNWQNENRAGIDTCSWTFRKAEKFFDVVTYTGTGVARTIAHNLGSVPACMIIKRTDLGSSNWFVYHSGIATPEGYEILLNSTANADTNSNVWNNTAPTDSVFSIGAGPSPYAWNASGGSYVAYLFASDAGGFGDDGDENIIKCGSYTGNGSTNGPVVDVGFEPQWLLIKRTSSTENWPIYDNMRGMAVGGTDTILLANGSDSESAYAGQNDFDLTATGFKLVNNSGRVNESGNNYIYIAIRRPMKTPESGTEVFAVDTGSASSTTPTFDSGFPVDWAFFAQVSGAANRAAGTRLLGSTNLLLNTTNAESGNSNLTFDSMSGWAKNYESSNYSWMFKRATGFFDVVAYTGTGVAGREIAHNLGSAPAVIIVKSRDNAVGWAVYHSSLGATKYLTLNLTDEANTNPNYWNDTEPTSTNFTVAGTFPTNRSGYNYVAYLFATLAGVSKVGSYTGTGADLNVDCGFSAGARFILIKRTDSTGDWYVWDSARGIVAGNDPYLLLNSTAAQVTSTDYIDPLSSGFTVTSSAPAALNASGGSYIFLAIA